MKKFFALYIALGFIAALGPPRLWSTLPLDAQGWTILTPSSDTVTIYVSNSDGNDANDGLSPEHPKKTIAAGVALLRNGFPDWVLLKRGDVWQSQSFSINMSGRSLTEPMVFSSYGVSSERPMLKGNNTIWIANARQHLAFVGLSLYASTRDPNSPEYVPGGTGEAIGFYFYCPGGGGGDVLVEDCLFRFFNTGIIVQDHGLHDISIRRTLVLDSYSTSSHSQGTYIYSVDGLLLEENIFDHNGWNEQIPGAEATVFNHNMYIKENVARAVFRGNIIARGSATGTQARSGGIVEENLFLRNPIGLDFGLVNGSPVTAGGVEGRVSNNVFLEDRDISGGPRGYAMDIWNTKPGANVTITSNIFAHSLQRAYHAIIVQPGSASNINEAVGVNDLTISHNVVYKWRGGLQVNSSLVPGTAGAYGLNNLVVSNNEFQVSNGLLWGADQWPMLIAHDGAFNPTYETFNANVTWDAHNPSVWFQLQGKTTSFDAWKSAVDANAKAERVPYPDPERDMGTYDASLGGAGTLESFLARARLQSKANWDPAATAAAANDYIRAGFGLSPTVWYSISANADKGGTITPQGNIPIPSGSNRTFVIKPGIGYKIADVTMDGQSQGTVSSFVFQSVTGNHTIQAVFASAAFSPGDNPTTFGKFKNVMNPTLNETMSIVYNLEQEGPVNLTVLDSHGNKVKSLVNESQLQGQNAIVWDGRNAEGSLVASGVYILKMKAGGKIETKKIMVIK